MLPIFLAPPQLSTNGKCVVFAEKDCVFLRQIDTKVEKDNLEARNLAKGTYKITDHGLSSIFSLLVFDVTDDILKSFGFVDEKSSRWQLCVSFSRQMVQAHLFRQSVKHTPDIKPLGRLAISASRFLVAAGGGSEGLIIMACQETLGSENARTDRNGEDPGETWPVWLGSTPLKRLLAALVPPEEEASPKKSKVDYPALLKNLCAGRLVIDRNYTPVQLNTRGSYFTCLLMSEHAMAARRRAIVGTIDRNGTMSVFRPNLSSLIAPLSTVGCNDTGDMLCLSDVDGKLYWWGFNWRSQCVLVEDLKKYSSLPLAEPQLRARHHWHSAGLSAVVMRGAETLAGGQLSKVVSWNVCNETGVLRSLWPVTDGSILDLVVPEGAERNNNTRLLAVTSTNKIYLVDTAKADCVLLVAGRAIPAVTPSRWLVMLLHERTQSVCAWTSFRRGPQIVRRLGIFDLGDDHRYLLELLVSRFSADLGSGAHDPGLRLLIPKESVSEFATKADRKVPELELSARLVDYVESLWYVPSYAPSSKLESFPHCWQVTAAAGSPENRLIILGVGFRGERDTLECEFESFHYLQFMRLSWHKTKPVLNLVIRVPVVDQVVGLEVVASTGAHGEDQGLILKAGFRDGKLCKYSLSDIDKNAQCTLIEKRYTNQILREADWRKLVDV